MALLAVEYSSLDGSIKKTVVFGEVRDWFFITRTVIGPKDQLREWSVYDQFNGSRVNKLGSFKSIKQARIFVDLLNAELGWAFSARDEQGKPKFSPSEWSLVDELERLARMW